MPLLFIALFLASFLVGSGVGHFVKTPTIGESPVSTPYTTPYVTPDPQFACLPEEEIINQKYQLKPQDSAIIIEATGDLPHVGDMGSRDNWTEVLLWLFGGEEKGPFPPHFSLDRRQNTWTLIKRDVPIPSGKVAYSSGNMHWIIPDCIWNESVGFDRCSTSTATGYAQTIKFHEMTRIGVLNKNNLSDSYLKSRYLGGTDEAVGDVWIATGWCGALAPAPKYPEVSDEPISSQERCDDPLIKDLLFVVTTKGDGPRLGRDSSFDQPLTPADADPNNWWRFDVYYDFDFRRLPISYNSLPCWMKSCGRAPLNADDPNLRIGDPTCSLSTSLPNNLFKNLASKLKDFFSIFFLDASAQTTQFPQFVSGKGISFSDGISEEEKERLLTNTYIIGAPTTPATSHTNVGTITDTFGTTFNVLVEGNELAKSVPKGAERIFLQSSTTMSYSFIHSEAEEGKTIKLDTFMPGASQYVIPPLPASFTYEWYTPACKPAIYLYPEKETQLSVYVKPYGRITESIPIYGEGWQNVSASPNGEIIYQGNSYPYLYYEAEIKNITPPKYGWVIRREELLTFFNTILPYLGLNKKESADFKDYWLKKLTDKPYYFIGLLERNKLEKFEKIEFTQKPDTFIRVRFYFEGLDKSMVVSPPLLPKTPSRSGFTAVDWGGIIANGTCGDSYKSE